MSLRTRLIVGLLALAAVGLLVADGVTYGYLRGFLTDRVDAQLRGSGPAVARALRDVPLRGTLDVRPPPQPAGGPDAQLPPGTYAEVRLDGQVLGQVRIDYGEEALAPPKLPDRLPAGRPVTVPSDGGSYDYRAIRFPLQRGELVVAISLHDVQSTLARLRLIEGVATAAVLAALAAVAWWVVGLGMRPLAEMERTAEQIAGGDLSRRVAEPDPRTETGRLARSLNAMLERIEEAFRVRTASEQRMRRFLADASHELRTPLTSIRGYAELFRRGADANPQDLARAMRRIEDEAARMGVLVDDLLLLARIDEGRPLARAAVDLTGVAADACSDARAVAPDRTVSLQATGPVVVTGDEPRLRQVAANLMANALRHTPAGTPIEVRVATDDGAGVLEVTDHGPGIPPADLDRVFDRFYRSDLGRTRDAGGAGLGLAIVSAVVAAHGGEVAVANVPGAGARFTVRLPA